MLSCVGSVLLLPTVLVNSRFRVCSALMPAISPNSALADGVFLSDGTLNIAILNFKTDQLGKGLDYRGIHHFGVLVEDVAEFSKKLETLGADYYIDRSQKEPNAGYFEKKFYGPERVLFDIAEHPWAGCEPLPAEIKEAAE